MAITRKDFCTAEGGDLFVDSDGQKWHILHCICGIIPGIKVRKGDGIKSLFWYDNTIVDEKMRPVSELIRQEARLNPS